jgi:peptide deformylase
VSGFASHLFDEIINCDNDSKRILRQPTSFLSEKEWHLVEPVVEKLLYVRNKVLKGGAGLAAPQIGLSLPIFIYTPDRTTENLRSVINPSFVPLGHETITGSEACFSVPLRCVRLPRWERIKIRYQTTEKKWIEKEIEGFEAKVFQHEMDHLQGKLTLDHEKADVLTFFEPQLFQDHMREVHAQDSKRY